MMYNTITKKRNMYKIIDLCCISLGTVDDHFAKALGNKTWNKLKNDDKSPTDSDVDDHFAKALGATWHQIQSQRQEHTTNDSSCT